MEGFRRPGVQGKIQQGWVIDLALRGAGWISRVIGDGGASIVSRVMGLILASIAVNNVLEGIRTYFS